MTTHRYEDVMEPSYTPRTTRSDREVKYLPSREEICAAKRIDTELCSSNLVLAHLKKVRKKRYKNLER